MGPIILLILFVLIVAFIWKQRQDGRPQEDLLSLLEKRYARGEITREQFEEMKKDLTERPG
ncbi:MAG: SHOCT domain-containing protein [Deltaproteobacteria bacterium]|nr:SHOCT domain-containing protein [Deltaproteobacteria bacterium]